MAETLIDRIVRHEGFRSHVYQDAKGYLSIGHGQTVGRIELSNGRVHLKDEGLGITKRQARKLLLDRLEEISIALCVIPGYAWRGGVLIEMAYQLGVAGLMKFKRMWAALELGRFDRAADEMLDSAWARQTPSRAKELADIMRNGEADA